MALHGRQHSVEVRVLNGAILICGATGHAGNPIAMTAADQGARPIPARRYLDRVKAVAEPLGLRNDLENPRGRVAGIPRRVPLIAWLEDRRSSS